MGARLALGFGLATSAEALAHHILGTAAFREHSRGLPTARARESLSEGPPRSYLAGIPSRCLINCLSRPHTEAWLPRAHHVSSDGLTRTRRRPRRVGGRRVVQGREADGCEGVWLRARMRCVRLRVSALAPILGTRPLRGACVVARLWSSVLGTRPCPGACDLGYEGVERSVERDGLRSCPRALHGWSQSNGRVCPRHGVRVLCDGVAHDGLAGGAGDGQTRRREACGACGLGGVSTAGTSGRTAPLTALEAPGCSALPIIVAIP